jgi:hypothetical protein
MKWRCALIQRWLPAYPDGDLPSFWRGRIESHLKGCAACREELAGLEEVVRMVRTAPVPDPEPEFWESFNRELHLQLAQSTPEPPPARSFKIPYYLLGAPALVGLLLWITSGYFTPERSAMAPRPQAAKQERVLEKKVAKTPAPAPATASSEAVLLVTQNGDEMPPDDDLEFLEGDLDSTLAGMTDKEKEAFLKKMRRHNKDGSCIRKYSAIFWA